MPFWSPKRVEVVTPVRPGVSYFTPLRPSGRMGSAMPQGGVSRDELYEVISENFRDGFFSIGKIIQVRLYPDEWDERTRRMVANQQIKPHMIFRRGVVIDRDAETVMCLAIKTYQGKGTTRPDICPHAGQHALIYTTASPPRLLRGEHNLCPPIQAVPLHDSDNLAPTARLNYDGAFLVPYDREIRAIAEVKSDNIDRLLQDYERISGNLGGLGGLGGPGNGGAGGNGGNHGPGVFNVVVVTPP
ncbi:hypothetical protein IWZ00DRAFT_83835 [Phyllosticta capitalensis]|uniref:DUF6590 domain-containing protein n=2 Tax=Phyllosticta capitalensis TaxID=121624 RepID=A0ABR1YHX8_9PEZI